MPNCKNAPTAHYKGTELSPKGRGYCARAELVGKRRKGKDNQMWVVVSYKTKGKFVKRWQHVKKVISKKKKQPIHISGGSRNTKGDTMTSLNGWLLNTEQQIHELKVTLRKEKQQKTPDPAKIKLLTDSIASARSLQDNVAKQLSELL